MGAIIAVDVGGTNTRFAVVDDNLSIVERHMYRTDPNDPKTFFKELKQFITKSKQQVSAVGISFPGPLDTKNGMVLTPPNLPGWHYYPIVETVKEETGLDCSLEGDARCAGLSEAVVGAAKGFKTVFYITVSTGVGSSIIRDGVIDEGDHGFAGEIANCILWKNGPRMGSLQAGAIECIASGTGILRRAHKEGLTVNDTKQVFDLHKASNSVASMLIYETIDYLSNFLAIVQTIVDPSMVVMGGSVITHNDWVIEEIMNSIRKKVYPDLKKSIKISVSKNKDDAGLLGAAIIAKRFVELALT